MDLFKGIPRKGSGMTMGESAFWMTTFEQHGSSIMAFLTSRTGRRDVAEDLLQETFIRAIRAKPDLPDAARVRAYLFTTAHRLLISRSRRKRPLLFSEIATDDSPSMADTIPTDIASPEQTADLTRLQEKLDTVLETLTADHRTAFKMAVLQQMPYSEIAEQRGWSLGQVKTNVHRARKKVIGALHEMLGPKLENPS